MVLAPNLLMLWCPPRPPLRPVSVPWVVRVLERTGQGACAVVPAIAVPGEHLRWWWALPGAAAVMAYYLLWGRYLLAGRDPVSLYQRWGPIPIPMAITPISILLAAAPWLHTIWIAVAALVLAAGHIPSAVGRLVTCPSRTFTCTASMNITGYTRQSLAIDANRDQEIADATWRTQSRLA